jgi:hypothetical protein
LNALNAYGSAAGDVASAAGKPPLPKPLLPKAPSLSGLGLAGGLAPGQLPPGAIVTHQLGTAGGTALVRSLSPKLRGDPGFSVELSPAPRLPTPAIPPEYGLAGNAAAAASGIGGISGLQQQRGFSSSSNGGAAGSGSSSDAAALAGGGRGSRGVASSLLLGVGLEGHPGAVAAHGRRRRSLLPRRYGLQLCVMSVG